MASLSLHVDGKLSVSPSYLKFIQIILLSKENEREIFLYFFLIVSSMSMVHMRSKGLIFCRKRKKKNILKTNIVHVRTPTVFITVFMNILICSMCVMCLFTLFKNESAHRAILTGFRTQLNLFRHKIIKVFVISYGDQDKYWTKDVPS